jgi:protein TonB
MFEHSLIDLEAKPPQRRRWISLPIAVGLHVVALTAFAFASYWTVSDVPEPELITVFFQSAPLPELLGGGGGRPKPPETTPKPPEPTPAEIKQPVQPTEQSVPDEVPPATTSVPVESFLDDLLQNHGGGDDPGPAGDCPGCPVGPGVGPGPIGPGEVPGGGDGTDDLAPIRFTVGMTRPEPVHRVQPRYTEAARKAGVQGTVIVEAIIDEQGNVRDARVLRGLPLGLDREAVDAILQWKFKPARLNDRPVRVYFNLTATFTIQR